MTKGFLVALAIVASPILWIVLLVPLIAKGFGVQYKIGILPFDRRNEGLSKWQSFWFAGVLGWGICVFLVGFLIQSLGEFAKKANQPPSRSGTRLVLSFRGRAELVELSP